MARNDYTLPFSFWTPLHVPSPATMEYMDQRASEAIDGYNGGSWNPSNPIIIGGKGLYTTAAFIRGGVTVGKRAMPGGLCLGDNDYPSYSPSRIRTVMLPIRGYKRNGDLSGISAVGKVVPMGGTQINGATAIPLPSNLLMDGSTLVNATLKFSVGKSPTSVPSGPGLPAFHIMAYNRDQSAVQVVAAFKTRQSSHTYAIGDVVILSPQTDYAFTCVDDGDSAATQPGSMVTATEGTIIVDGGVQWRAMRVHGEMYGVDFQYIYNRMPDPLSPITAALDAATYYKNGTPQKIEVIGFNTNPILDTKKWSYFLHIWDDTTTDNVYHSLSLTTQLTDMRPAL